MRSSSGQSFESKDDAPPASLDSTSYQLMAKIVMLAATNGRLAGIPGFAFRRIEEQAEGNSAVVTATDLLKRCLEPLEPDKRLDQLLELYDTVKNPKA